MQIPSAECQTLVAILTELRALETNAVRNEWQLQPMKEAIGIPKIIRQEWVELSQPAKLKPIHVPLNAATRNVLGMPITQYLYPVRLSVP